MESPSPPFNIPDHELIRCIGRGSYGEVWLARNIMGIYRAVKFVRRESFDNARPFERELSGIRRFEPISRSHDGFVDVLHIGQNESKDSFYYVMELGDDRDSGQEIDEQKYAPKTLAHVISRSGKLQCQECLQLGLGLTKALAALHKSGLVHRDIKPSNIIFVLGAPKLADIGLVAGIGEAMSFVGTEGYIPPEGPGSAQADIYSLGRLLYETGTGKDRLDFPELPSQWDKSPEHDRLLELNEVWLRASANDPAKRYRTADEMHADLVLLANGQSLRRLRLLERRFANVKRMARLSLAILGVLAVLAFQGYREWKNIVESRKRQVLQSVKDGTQAMESGNLLTALRHCTDGLQLDQGSAERELPHRMRFGSVLSQCPKLVQLWLAEGAVEDVQFSPDGQKVVVAEEAGSVKIFDLEASEALPSSFGSGGYLSATYSSNGLWILAAGQNNTASLWDAKALTNIYSLPHPEPVRSGRFSPDGGRFVTACADKIARVWDTRSGELVLKLEGHSGGVRFAAFSPDGKWIVTTSQDGTARIWNAVNGQLWRKPLPHPNWLKWVNHAAFSGDSKTVVTACEDHIARSWDIESSRRLRPDLHHQDVLCCVEYSPDGSLILTASLDGVVRLWHSDTLEPLSLNPILTHPERVTSAAFDPIGHKIVTASADGTVRIWDIAGAVNAPFPLTRAYNRRASRFLTVSNNTVQLFDALTELPAGGAIRVQSDVEYAMQSRDGQFVVIVSKAPTNEPPGDRIAQVFAVATAEPVGPVITISGPLKIGALSDDGMRLALHDDASLEIRDIRSGRTVFPPLKPASSVERIQFSPDRKRIATWGGNTVQLWDAEAGKPSFDQFEMEAPVKSVEFSSDGSYLAAACADRGLNKRFARVWKTATGKPGPPLRHGDGVLCASFSPDNKYLVTGGEDYAAMVWEFATGRLMFPAIRHPNQVGAAAFSPNSKWIVTICADNAARVFNAATGEPVTPPLRHLGSPRTVMFLPDSSKIVTADLHGRTWVWDLSAIHSSVEDLSLLSRLLSGDSLRAAGDTSPQEPAAVKAICERLRVSCPSAFTVSSNQVTAWHEFQALELEDEGHKQWPAAAFHWKELLKLRPGDPDITEHLKRAEQKMAEPKPTDE